MLEEFELFVYDSMIEWSDFSDEVPGLEEVHWQRSNRMPVQGEMRVIQVILPFRFEVGGQFWALFTPAMSHFNGWEEFPEEIETSAVVHCFFEEILAEDKNRAWVRLRIMEVLPVPEISSRFPVVKCSRYLDELMEYGKKWAKLMEWQYECWTFYSWSDQGDVGQWALIHRRDCGSRHMVLYGDWYPYHDNVYCGNLQV